jgi:hypothetical protein
VFSMQESKSVSRVDMERDGSAVECRAGGGVTAVRLLWGAVLTDCGLPCSVSSERFHCADFPRSAPSGVMHVIANGVPVVLPRPLIDRGELN